MKPITERVLAGALCGLCLAIAAFVPSAAGQEKKPAGTPIYRMNQLEDAKKRAAAENKPIAWIASAPECLAPVKDLKSTGGHAATQYAIRALQNETVLVFSDAFKENHQEPAIVDEALHSPNSRYTIPGVVILTPSMDKVITKAFYIEDSQERIRVFTEMLKTIRDKDSWNK